MSARADELRKQAAALEEHERLAAIVARCRAGRYVWHEGTGKCYREYSEFVPCSGLNGYKHFKSYTDGEYGDWHFCHGCNGSGSNFITHRVPCPEYDAPQPPKEDA